LYYLCRTLPVNNNKSIALNMRCTCKVTVSPMNAIQCCVTIIGFWYSLTRIFINRQSLICNWYPINNASRFSIRCTSSTIPREYPVALRYVALHFITLRCDFVSFARRLIELCCLIFCVWTREFASILPIILLLTISIFACSMRARWTFDRFLYKRNCMIKRKIIIHQTCDSFLRKTWKLHYQDYIYKPIRVDIQRCTLTR